MEIEDLKNERDKANSEMKKLVSAQDGHSYSKGGGGTKSTINETDSALELANIEGKIDQLKKVGDGDNSFFTIFEAYKAAVNNELNKYKKNIQLLRKENDSLKSSAVDARKKEELIEKLKRKIEESEDDQSISSLSTRLKQSKRPSDTQKKKSMWV